LVEINAWLRFVVGVTGVDILHADRRFKAFEGWWRRHFGRGQVKVVEWILLLFLKASEMSRRWYR
jgi:hypothetical protein